MLVSVVVPVYNIKDYIEECIVSVINQTYEKLECILVDDGSTDGSESICDLYAQKFEKVFAIHQVNGGLAAARNTGLKYAKGEYVYFLDGDDMLTAEAIEHFVKAIDSNCDIVLGQMAFFYDNRENENEPFGEVIKKEWVQNKTGKEAFVEIHNHINVMMMGVRGLYKRNYLIANKLEFNEYFRYSEDQEWTPRCFELANRVSSNEYRDYLYRMGRQGSLMNTINPRKIELTLEIYDKWYEKILSNSADPYSVCLNNVLIRRFWECYFKYPQILKKEDCSTFYKMMDKRKGYLVNNPLVKKVNKYAILIKVLPAKYICLLTKIWLKIKS